jgi:hypothetical protein
MSQAQFSAFGRLFDRAVSLVIISLGAVLAGAVAVVGG